MSELRKGACRSCGAEIVWAKTSDTDKNIPLDAKPERRFVFLSDDVVKLKETYQHRKSA